MTSPREAGFRAPAEWAPHVATWVAWPSHADLWAENLAPAREAFSGLVAAIVDGERADGEVVEVLVPDAESEALARASLPARRVRFHRVPFGDIWLRDTGPIFVQGPRQGETGTVRFRFNGWGGKYVLEHDDRVGERVSELAGASHAFAMPFVLEGGAIDVDGAGSILTTRECLLNANRNPSMTEQEIERAVLSAVGGEKVMWIDRGLLNDHTDGHVDTIIRFVAPGTVVTMEPRLEADPNRAVLEAIAREAAALVDARGRKLNVVRVPSPGCITDDGGRVLPASYVNFYIANACVVVPTYGSPFDDEAVELLGALFPGRRTVGIDARGVLAGGGAFHCITQQQPRGAER